MSVAWPSQVPITIEVAANMNRTNALPFLYCIVAALAFALVGCGTVVKPSNLKPPATKTSVNLQNGYTYFGQFGGICQHKIKYSLAPGSYVSELESDEGTFFRGAAGSLSTLVTASECAAALGRGLKIDAGIFIPKKPEQQPLVYYYNPPKGIVDVFVITVTGPSAGDPLMENRIAQQAAPNAGVGTSAAGGAIGGAIVQGLIEADYGAIQFTPLLPKDGSLRSAMTPP